MKKILPFVLFALASDWCFAGEVEAVSRYNFNQTVDRYIGAIKQAGIPIIDAKTSKNKITGKSEAVVVFGNPLFGSRVGECNKGVRKDTPLEAHIREDGSQRVILSYELPDSAINEFGVIMCGHEADNMRKALNRFASNATE